MTSIKDSLVLIAICGVFLWMGFALGHYKARADIYHTLTTENMNEAVKQLVDHHLSIAFPEAK